MLQEVRKHLQTAAQREKEILKLSGHSDVSDVLSINYIHLLCACGRSCFKCIIRSQPIHIVLQRLILNFWYCYMYPQSSERVVQLIHERDDLKQKVEQVSTEIVTHMQYDTCVHV